MDLKLIDQALDVAIAGLLYGTEAWFVCAFSLHIADRWKRHAKESDLRKASIAKACGVRTRPIGSQRNLLKADLIAQYEQNLNRVTKRSPRQIVSKMSDLESVAN